MPSSIKLSVIVFNHNNALYLPKCISSLLTQSLEAVEFIIVDDASDDQSKEIISSFAKGDERIHPMLMEHSQGLHICRKLAISEACGQYVMFMDSVDFYDPKACEIAADYMDKGWDAAAFGINVIAENALPDISRALHKRYNIKNVEMKYYGIDNILTEAFVERSLPWDFFNKIFKTDLCKAAFSEMEDVFISEMADLYEFFVIASHADSFINFPNNLIYINSRVRESIRASVAEDLDTSLALGSCIQAVKRYCDENELDKYYTSIKNIVFDTVCSPLLPLLQESNAKYFFDCLVRDFGLLFVCKRLMHNYFEQWSLVADKIALLPPVKQVADKKNVAIFYYRLTHGGVERVVADLCDVLLNAGYVPHLILEEKSAHGIALDKRVRKHYVSHSLPYTLENMSSHLDDLSNLLIELNIGLVLYEWSNGRSFLWDILLTRLLNIPLIGALHSELAFATGVPRGSYTAQAQYDVMRCASKITCLSKSSETVLRSFGIDAVYLPNGTQIPEDSQSRGLSRPIMAFIGRLDNHQKRILHVVRILAEARKSRPDLGLLCIGGFDDPKKEEKFYELAKSEGLSGHVHVTGWTNNVGHFLDQCQLVICTSWWESFHLGILEAQARGLPCVTYELPIAQAENNPGIIFVPRDDWRAAAREIVTLINDENVYRQCSQAACKSAQRFSSKVFASNMLELLRNFQRICHIRYDTAQDYRRHLKWLAFYAGKPEPQE